ncbi:MAG: glycosyltransferase family 39 protein [Actinobacteria bacterium]|nr:glycosyltransferase family 39 protein [Actinomycetota bacterium]MBU1943396.1 glycosyltransferase family 39 protein [Actinomycetota bacterium]MBU2686753.1 glycosyltransferase family 39 protein [Actinomycetota bacterium]
MPAEKEPKNGSLPRWLVWCALGGIAAVFFYLRLRNLHQVLPWDEAQLALTIRSFSAGQKDVWSSLARIHPPFYLWLMSGVARLLSASGAIYRFFSVVFSFGTLAVTYLLARRLYGEKVALLAAFCLAVMPAALVMDTWVKQDPLADLLVVLAIFLFVRENWVWAGIAFGIGMLTKETAVFALAVIFLYSLATWDGARMKRTAGVAGIGFLMSSWWYVWFSRGVGHSWEFFRTGGSESPLFGKPFLYYFTGLPRDLGWPLFVLMLAGLAACVYHLAKRREKDYVLPLVWFGGIYLFLSFSVGKPYWMIPPAFPALALLCGIGALGALDLCSTVFKEEKPRKVALVAVVAVVVVVGLVSGVTLGYLGYNKAKMEQYWDYAVSTKNDARLMRSGAGDTPVVVVLDEKSLDREAVLTYYLGDTPQIVLASGAMTDPEALLQRYVRQYFSNWLYIKKGQGAGYAALVDSFLARLPELTPFDMLRDTPWAYVLNLK